MLLPLLALAVTIQSKVGYGSELYNNCQIYLSYTRPGLAHADQDATKAAGCTSFVEGFIDGGYKVGGFCPKGHALGYFVQAYVDYMDQHTDLLEKPKAVGLSAVLKEQFPCSQ
jgi:hypothetical protein